MQGSLLAGEEDPVVVLNGEAASPFLLVCEHAGRKIPKSLGNLGLEASDLEAHIAWDIGAEAVSRGLAERLRAPLVLQRYSRLVYDCNRPPEAPDAIPAVSEVTPIPGNAGLTAAAREERTRAIYRPFHAKIAELIERRLAKGILPTLVTIHSFTPVYKGRRRIVELGLLHDTDSRLADAMLAAVGRQENPVTRRNEPYGPEDGVTHTLKIHALPRGLLNVMIEIRNDLVRIEREQASWVERLANLLTEALATFRGRTAARA
ncbi:MAG: N-formylglutamate amidohydrolase [Parvibaculaceae bacterium]